MPFFRYLGMPKAQQVAFIEAHMRPLLDDEEPHPRFGGFPLVKPNEIGYYPDKDDNRKVERVKQQKRDDFRKQKLAELEDEMLIADSIMVFTVGRKPGKPDAGKRFEFPKGKVVEVPEFHTKLINKLRALSGQVVTKKNKKGEIVAKRQVVEIPSFEEVIPEQKPEQTSGNVDKGGSSKKSA